MLASTPKRPDCAGHSAAAVEPLSIVELQRVHTVILLRWVLIVATSYLVLFSRTLAELEPAAALFVAAYLASNVLFTEVVPWVETPTPLEWALIAVDTAALSLAVVLTGSATGDLFVLYFIVLFLSALSERIALVVGGALLVAVAHISTVSHFVGVEVLFLPGYLLRIPFLLVVALFFGHLVHHSRARERQVEERRTHEMRLGLLATVSHDLKNPLGVIEALADMLIDGYAGPLDANQADFARRIKASARQVIVLSENLIDAERIGSGHLVVQRRPTQLADVINRTLVVAGSASAIKGVALRASVEPGLPSIDIDPVQIERVVANLLDNAIKFTPSGGRVRLNAERRRDGLVVSVCDEGPGIPAEDYPRLAERHFRGARGGENTGTGLGLYIVRTVVEAHGGKLTVRTDRGGTTMSFSLPLPPGARREAEAVSGEAPAVVAGAA